MWLMISLRLEKFYRGWRLGGLLHPSSPKGPLMISDAHVQASKFMFCYR